MELTFGDVQETALIPLAIKASETARSNGRITWFDVLCGEFLPQAKNNLRQIYRYLVINLIT